MQHIPQYGQMITARPLISRALGKMRPIKPWNWPGFPSQQLAPATVLQRSQSIALPDEYDRITHAIEGCDLAEWIAEARGGPQEQPATMRYNLGTSLIADGTVYYRGGYEVFRPGNARALAKGTSERFAELQLASVSVTEQFFGHWLTDTSSMLVLAAECGVEALVPWTDAATQWGHRAGYEALLALPFHHSRLAVVDKLWAVDDKPRNAARAQRLNEVRARVRANNISSTSSGKRIAILRGLSGVRRHLINEDDILELLAQQYGFQIVDPSTLAPTKIVAALSNADFIVGVEGSHLFHAVVAAKDEALIFAIMPPNRFSPAVKWYTDMIGMRFGFTVADMRGEDMYLPVDRLHVAMANVERHR